MAQATAKIDDKQWRKYLKSVRHKVKNANPFLKVAYATYGFKDIINHFKQGQGSKGKWAKLKFRKGRPLQDTGHLRNSITPSRVYKDTRQSVMILAGAKYSGYHDEGTNIIPKRDFMWFTDRAKDKMGALVLKLVAKG